MSTPPVDPTMRMHKALMMASAFVTRVSDSDAFEKVVDAYPTAARAFADLTLELNALGYIDEMRAERGPARRKRAARKPTRAVSDE